LLLLWSWQQIRQGEIRVRSNPLFAPMLAFAVLLLLQIVLGTTAYRYATSTEALLYISYGLLCFLAVQSLPQGKEVGRIAAAISGYGLLVALFAIVHSLSSNGKLYWLRTPRSGGWIYGPYVNHNHYAGLMELLVPIPLVLCLSRRVRRGPKIFFAAAALVMASTIFLSGSRGGMAAFLVQFLGLAVYVGTRRKSPRLAIAFGGFVLLAGLVVVWLGGAQLPTAWRAFIRKRGRNCRAASALRSHVMACICSASVRCSAGDSARSPPSTHVSARFIRTYS
jgi:O-antigen ligase